MAGLWTNVESVEEPDDKRVASKGGKYKYWIGKDRSKYILEKGEPDPSFRCPLCKTHFKLEYGVFGKLLGHMTDPLGESQYWCRDCAYILRRAGIDFRKI